MSKQNNGVLLASLIFCFMLLTMLYHICGDLWPLLLRKLIYNGSLYLFIIGLLIVSYNYTSIIVIKSLIKYSAIPYCILQLTYSIGLYLSLINSNIDIIFVILFFLTFGYGLFKIRKINHDLTIEN